MGCKGRARPLHARASGTSVRITCDFTNMGHVHYIQHDRALARAAFSRNVSILRAQAIATVEKTKMMPSRCTIGRDSPCVKTKTKTLASLHLFFRLGTPFRPRKAKIGSFMANYPRFHAPTRDLEPRNNPQSQKSCNSSHFFCFRAPGAASGRRHRRGGYFGGTMGGNPAAASRGSLDAAS